jgi:signal transduction histidine kinase/CheY-like chemotaxis protein/PAS domain-containing protein
MGICFDVDKAPVGLATHRIVYNKSGETESTFIESANDALCNIINQNKSQLTGTESMVCMHPMDISRTDWMAIVKQVIKHQTPFKKEYFSPSLNSNLLFNVFSTDMNQVVSMVQVLEKNMSEEDLFRSITKNYEDFLNSEDAQPDYQVIAERLKDLTDAKYVIYNQLSDDEKYFQSVGLSLDTGMLGAISAIFGFSITQKKWENHNLDLTNEDYKKYGLAKFNSIEDITSNYLSANIVKGLQKVLLPGEIIVLKVSKYNEHIGDFIVIMDSGKKFDKDWVARVYARQFAMVLARKKAEEQVLRYQNELKKQNQLIESILENAPIGIWITSPINQRPVLVNKFTRDNFDLIPEEVLQCKLSDDAVLDNDAPGEFEEKITFKDGKTHILQTIKTKISGDDGQVVGILGLGLDITHRKKVEDENKRLYEFQQLLMSMSSEFINLPFEEIENAINTALKRMCLFVKADRAYLFTYDHVQKTTTNTHEYCVDGIEPQIDNLQNIPMALFPEWVESHMNGKVLHIPSVIELPDCQIREALMAQDIKSLVTLPLMNRDWCIGFVGFDSIVSCHHYSVQETQLLRLFSQMLVNVQNRFNLENEIRLAKSQAEAASKYKSEFLANMSHEIRTPLNGVVGFTELLTYTPLTCEQHQYVKNVSTSALTLMDIINDVLDLSKIEAGKLELEEQLTDVALLMEQTADIVKQRAHEKSIDLYININPADLPLIQADPVRLKQILLNLAGNAVKFTEKGEVEIGVVMDNADHESAMCDLTFYVKDTGLGISDIQKEKLFQSFTQADSSTTRKYGGTGLGLKISKMLADKMNGILELTSTTGIGSKFSLKLRKKYQYTKDSPALGLKQVLLVEHRLRSTEILKNWMNAWGLETTTADNPLKSLEILESKKLDAIIINYHLPFINGLETIAILQKQLSSKGMNLPPVILLQGAGEDMPPQEEFEKLNICHQLDKPVKKQELFDALQRISGNSWLPAYENAQSGYATLSNENPVKILVAEDVEINMLLVSKMISKYLPHALIIPAINGIEVIEKFADEKPDLILMDVQMPEKDGIEATREIRKLEADIGIKTPIIALTAGALTSEKDRCLEAGMDHYITKPIKGEVLFDALNRYIKLEEKGELKDNSENNGAEKIDIAYVMEILDNDLEECQDIMKQSVEKIKGCVLELGKLDHVKDKKAMLSLIHIIKGTSLNLKYNDLASAAENLERSLYDGKEPSTLLRKLEYEFNFVKKQIGQFLNSNICQDDIPKMQD